MNGWNETDKSLVVNLYYFKKMLWQNTSIEEILAKLKESYDGENGEFRNIHTLSFRDWVNKKRQLTASILGMDEYF